MENRVPRHTFQQAGAKVQRVDQPGGWAVVEEVREYPELRDKDRDYWVSRYGQEFVAIASRVYTCKRVVLRDNFTGVIDDAGKGEVFYPCYHVADAYVPRGTIVWVEPLPQLNGYLIYTQIDRLSSSYPPLRCFSRFQDFCVERDEQGRIVNIYYITESGERVRVPDCPQGRLFRCIPWNSDDFVWFLGLYDNYVDSILDPGSVWEMDSRALRWSLVPLYLLTGGSTSLPLGVGHLVAELSARPAQGRRLPNGTWEPFAPYAPVSARMRIAVGLRALSEDGEDTDTQPEEISATIYSPDTTVAPDLRYPDDLEVQFQGCDRNLSVTVTIKPNRWASGTIRIIPIPDPP